MEPTLVAALSPPDHVDLIVEGIDPELAGQQAALVVERIVTVRDDRPVHGEHTLARTMVDLDPAGIMVALTLGERNLYAYLGDKIAIELRATLKLERSGWFRRDKVLASAPVDVPVLRGRPDPTDDDLMEPQDRFDLVKNFRALDKPLQTSILASGGAYVALTSALLGSALYSFDFCVGFLAIGVGVGGGVVLSNWFKSLFREYAELEVAHLEVPADATRRDLAEVVSGRASVDIHKPRLRIVACNLECGQYRRGSGTDVRTVSFQEPFGAVVLYDRTAERWRKGTELHEAFSGEVDFGAVYASLLPPQEAGLEHGVQVRWEVQLLVPDFVDLEVVGAPEVFWWPSRQSEAVMELPAR